MKSRTIFCSLVNPYRKHSNGGSEDIRRRIEATASIFNSVTVYAIDYLEELVVPKSIPTNVDIHLYHRTLDPRPWRWHYPLACIRRYNRQMILDIRRDLVGRANPPLIFLEGMQLFGLWNDIKRFVSRDAKIILRAHNIESGYHQSVAGESRGLLRLAHQLSAKQYKRLEDDLLDEFTLTYCVSEREADALRNRHSELAKHVRLVLPIPQHTESLHSAQINAGAYSLAYFGDLTLPNNYTGLHWFCDNVLPRLESEHVHLRVAGKGSERFASYRSVEVCGFVDNLEDFLADSHVIIAPIFSGAGVKIKVLDSISYGKPLITTPKGAEGFPNWLRDRLNIAQDAEQFKEMINRLMYNYDIALTESAQTRHLLFENLGPERFQRQLIGDIR